MARKFFRVVSLSFFLLCLISASESASKRRSSGKRNNKHRSDDYDHPDQNDLIPIPDHYLDDNDDISYDDEEEFDEINDGKPSHGMQASARRENNNLKKKNIGPSS